MEPPFKPSESDCCNSGCNPCILDIYEEQVRKFNKRQNREDLSLFKNCLLSTCYSIFKLTKIEEHCKDAFLFTFEFVRFLKDHTDTNNLKVIYKPGQYLMLKAGPKNEQFQRPYTPIPVENQDKLKFTVLIKLYEIGQMSTYLRRLKVNKETVWRGPYGDFSISYNYKKILFIAQGVGIAPLYSIINDIVSNENCDTFLKLLYCCKSFNTIYLRNQLYNLQANWNFSYEIFLSNPENIVTKYNETILSLKLEEIILKNHIGNEFQDTQLLICGSKMFMSNLKKIVLNCGVPEQNIVTF